MTEPTKLAIETVLDIWDFRKVVTAHALDSPVVVRAFMRLREALREQVHVGHTHEGKCWLDKTGEDRPYRSCGEMDWLEQKEKILRLEADLRREKSLMGTE